MTRTIAGVLAGIIAGGGFLAFCTLTLGFVWPVLLPVVFVGLIVETLVEGWDSL